MTEKDAMVACELPDGITAAEGGYNSKSQVQQFAGNAPKNKFNYCLHLTRSETENDIKSLNSLMLCQET